MTESSCLSTSLPTFGAVSILDFSHSNRCVGVSHCFNLQVSFRMPICHLYIFFSEVSVYIFYPFLIELFVFLLLNFKNSLYILDISPLSDMCFINISFQSYSLDMPFTEQKFLILILQVYVELFHYHLLLPGQKSVDFLNLCGSIFGSLFCSSDLFVHFFTGTTLS